MKVIIIDDETQAISSLKKDLESIDVPIKVVGTACSVSDGIELLEREKVDILFLDIRLKDGLGFDILQKVQLPYSTKIIFTTAYDQYALKALKNGAFDYLLKPIDPDELANLLNKICSMENSYETDFHQALENFQTTISNSRRIALNTSEGIYLKNLTDIIRIESDGNYTLVYTTDLNKPIMMARTLKDFEAQLNDSFVRIHFSHLINLNHLDQYRPKDGGLVVMNNGDVVPVSARKKGKLISALKKKI